MKQMSRAQRSKFLKRSKKHPGASIQDWFDPEDWPPVEASDLAIDDLSEATPSTDIWASDEDLTHAPHPRKRHR